MTNQSHSAASPVLSARMGRRVIIMVVGFLIVASFVSLGVGLIVNSRVDRVPIELMSVKPTSPAIAYHTREMLAVNSAVTPSVQIDAYTVNMVNPPLTMAEEIKTHAVRRSTTNAATRQVSTTPMFDGRPIRRKQTMNMVVTGYSPDARSCGASADGITASGYSVWTNGMFLVAADTRLLPFGTLVSIPGYNGGQPVPVLDRGGAIKGRRLDLLFPTHEIALQWGRQSLPVTVWEYAD